jgi:hypothetical protein
MSFDTNPRDDEPLEQCEKELYGERCILPRGHEGLHERAEIGQAHVASVAQPQEVPAEQREPLNAEVEHIIASAFSQMKCQCGDCVRVRAAEEYNRHLPQPASAAKPPAEQREAYSSEKWEWQIAMQELDKLGIRKDEGEDRLTLWGRIAWLLKSRGVL